MSGFASSFRRSDLLTLAEGEEGKERTLLFCRSAFPASTGVEPCGDELPVLREGGDSEKFPAVSRSFIIAAASFPVVLSVRR